MPKYSGVRISNGAEVLVIPPMNLRMVRENSADVFEAPKEDEKAIDVMNRRLPLVLAAVQRNYPDYTEDQLMDFASLRIWPDMWAAALGTKNLPEVPGESEPAAQA